MAFTRNSKKVQEIKDAAKQRARERHNAVVVALAGDDTSYTVKDSLGNDVTRSAGRTHAEGKKAKRQIG